METLFSIVNVLTKIIVPIVFGIIAFLGVIGNTLVIVVVLTNQQMRSTTNVLILNLAVADLLFVIFCIPFTATDYVLNEWRFGLIVCQAVQYLIYVTSYVSIYTLILMSIDRFLAVVFPVRSISIVDSRICYVLKLCNCENAMFQFSYILRIILILFEGTIFSFSNCEKR